MTEPAPPHRPPPGLEDFPPEGRNSLAAIGQRGLARTIDTVLVLVPTVLVFAVLVLLTGEELEEGTLPWQLLVPYLVLAVAYETVAVAAWGQTAGKWLLGVRVARYVDGGRPSPTQAAQRILLPQSAIVIPLDIAGALVGLVYLTSTLDPLRRGVHDRYAGTVVIRTR